MTRPPTTLPGFVQLLLVLAPTLFFSDIGRGDDTKPSPKAVVLKGPAAADLVRLKREVEALETLYHLELTPAQMKAFLPLAEKSAAKPPAVKDATASPAYRQTLQSIRAALVRDDEPQVAALFQKLAEIEENDPIEMEDEFDITDAAMKAAPAALKQVTAAQIVSYLASMENEVPDPVERILLTISDGEELPAEEWNSLRDETASEVAWLVHGFNAAAAKTTAKAVSMLLDRGHALKGDALKKGLAGLESAAKKLAGAVGPIVVLQHYMEREIAELLSNPRAAAALKARINPLKK